MLTANEVDALFSKNAPVLSVKGPAVRDKSGGDAYVSHQPLSPLGERVGVLRPKQSHTAVYVRFKRGCDALLL